MNCDIYLFASEANQEVIRLRAELRNLQSDYALLRLTYDLLLSRYQFVKDSWQKAIKELEEK